MTDWSLRPARATDAPSLSRAFAAAYAPYLRRISGLPDVTGGLELAIADAGREVWVLAGKSALAGGIILTPEPPALHIENLAIAPDHAGQGLGQRLLSHAEGRARALGMTCLRLGTHSEMTATVALYRKLGFAETSRSGEKLSMEKPIEPAPSAGTDTAEGRS